MGDYHAMVSLGRGCSFSAGSVAACQEIAPGSAKDITLEDSLIKVFAACEWVSVETESAVGVLTEGPEAIWNGTTYSKSKLALDTDFLRVYSFCENDVMMYIELAVGEDDRAELLN